MLFIVTASFLAGSLLSVRPLVLAPAVDSFATIKGKPATSIAELTLNNVGPTLLSVLGIRSDDLMHLGMVVAVMFVGVTIAIAILNLIGQVVLIKLSNLLSYEMARDLHRHMLALPLGYFYKHKAGDLASRLIHDVNGTAKTMDSLARSALVSLAQLLVSVVILFRTEPLFAAMIAGLGMVHMSITKAMEKRTRAGSHEMAVKHGVVATGMFESLVGIRIIKSFATEKYESGKVLKILENYREAKNRFNLFKYYETPLRIVADAMVVGCVIIIVFYGVESGRLTLAGAAMFIFLSQQMTTPLGDIFSKLLGVNSLLGGAQRILDVFDTKSPMKDGSLGIFPLKEKISIENISFGYDKENPVLKNISLDIKQGEMIAFVGPSGAGKSTLADLLVRLYDVGDGAICYDGTDIREYKHEAYRRMFGVVSQECLLFNGTVRENILLDRVESEEVLEHAIWAANVGEFIDALPKGLNTIVGDRGIRLSGGQRQRVAIARAIYDKPSVLLLDEATSALDSESERAVQEAIDRVSEDVTTIAIAHRLSTVLHADKIVVLNQGRIEAIGSHVTLFKKSSTYKRLCQLQFMDGNKPQTAVAS